MHHYIIPITRAHQLNLRTLHYYTIIVTHAPYQLYITLTLYHSAQGQPIYWFLQILNSYTCRSFLLHSFNNLPLFPFLSTYGTFRNYSSYPATSKLIQDRDQSTKTQYSVPSAPEKLTGDHSRIWHLPAPTGSVRCYQACNGLSIGQTCHVKDSGCSIIWKCPHHGSGITEVIVPPAPVYEQPDRPSTVGKSCSVCRNPISTRFADLAYHCANPSCGNVCHLAAMCSRFVHPTGNASMIPSEMIPSEMQHWSESFHSWQSLEMRKVH